MSVALLLHTLADVVVRLDDRAPEPEDVKAGWTAFAVFLLLGAAVAVLGFSLVKQLRKAQAAKDAGVYGDEPAAADPPEPRDPGDPAGPARPTDPENHSTP